MKRSLLIVAIVGHDFGAMQLYTDMLPPDCVKQFHERYGEPVATATLPAVGRVELIPKR